MKFILPLLILAATSAEASIDTICGQVHAIKMEGRALFSVVLRKVDGTDQVKEIDVRRAGMHSAWMSKTNNVEELAFLDLAKIAIASPHLELCLDNSEAKKSFIRRIP